MERTIRQYTETDKQAVLEIYAAAEQSSKPILTEEVQSEQRKSLEDSLKQNTEDLFLLEVDGQVIGFASFLPQTVAMSGFYIHPVSQGRGEGRYLIEYLQSQKSQIKLAVYKDNRKAVRFYKKNGFLKERQRKDNSSAKVYVEMVWKESQ